MPIGIYERTEKHKEKMRKNTPFKKGHKINLGRKRPDMVGNKLSLGKEPWNKNVSGYSTSWKGRHHTEKTKRLQSKIRKKLIKEGKIKIFGNGLIPDRKGEKNPMYGKHHLKETRKKISLALKGHTSWNKGKSNYWCKGEKNYNWKGGITPINLVLRMSSTYKIWRELVFLRDNFTCQNPNCEFCHNKIGGELHPHHIKTFSEFPELRFNINNGITLCAEIHRSIKNKEEKYENLFLNILEIKIGARK